ncbi:Colicin I receptor precursor [Pseudomonas sp. THAF187a]|uniref:TonB-dependent receptor domain-containing protein n=1 Tax=unclassified Pseudomonas TaxID=196821 RepID=UPI0012685C82|nr:Colicin I receptor precursor [Pseudomonas sp. THAF187a]QFT41273.1 Colicin I receptor precursor [Pseudomonas sp. THAF42]
MPVLKMRRFAPRRSLSLLAFSFLPLGGQAEVLMLEPTVVSATSTKRALKDVPASVAVITAEDLSRRPVRDLEDALRGSEGLQFNGIGMSRRGISIRGMSSEHTLVLIDGKRISPSAGAIAHSDFDLGWVPVEAIERIEVVRGPMSSLYGSEALGGVVNVITRKATDTWLGSGFVEGGVREDGLGGQTHQAGGYVSGPLLPGVLGLVLNAESQRQQETPDFDSRNLSELEGRNGNSGGATLSWTPDDAQRIDFGYESGRERRWRNSETGGGASRDYEATDIIERERWSLAHSGDWLWGSSQLRAYRNQLERKNSRSGGAVPSSPQRLTDSVVDGNLSVPLLDMHRVTVGGEWRKEELEDRSVNARGEDEALHRAVFLQDEIAFSPAWSLTLGSRFDKHEQFGWENSPRVYLLHHLNDQLTLRAGVGKGFKAPSLKQLSPGYSAVGGGGRFTIVGNPDLQPETNTSYELGADYQAQGWSLSGMLFENDVEDLIQTVCVASCGVRGRELRNYENVDKARIRGVELGAGVDLSSTLSWKLNYTYLDARNRTLGQRLGDRSRHLANSVLQWQPTSTFEAQLRTEYIGSQLTYSSNVAYSLPAYSLWHLEMSQKLSSNLTLRGGIENIGDERLADQSERFVYAEPGRTYHVGLVATF